MHRIIVNLRVDENYYGSDHLPLRVKIKYNMLPNTVTESIDIHKIKWDFNDSRKKRLFVQSVNFELGEGLGGIPLCVDLPCLMLFISLLIRGYINF